MGSGIVNPIIYYFFFIKHFEFGKANYNFIHFGQLNRIFSRFIQLLFVMSLQHVKLTYFFNSINHVEENFIKKPCFSPIKGFVTILKTELKKKKKLTQFEKKKKKISVIGFSIFFFFPFIIFDHPRNSVLLFYLSGFWHKSLLTQ